MAIKHFAFTETARVATKDLIARGEAVKIELVVSTADEFNERVVSFLQGLGRLTDIGASRTVGVLDDSDMKDIQLFVDGDGIDRIRDVKQVSK